MDSINLFNEWATLGKDEGMAINHSPSVEYMLSLIPHEILLNSFSFLDIGCGNGWVVHKMSQMNNCECSIGIDGAKNMIQKAILKDKKSKYLQLDINNLTNFHEKCDIVFSMEVFYYLINPETTLEYTFKYLLKQGGCCIIGVDHYSENTASLKWKNDLNVDMCTYSISEWKAILEKVGFDNIRISQFGRKKDWEGTLVLYGEKNS